MADIPGPLCSIGGSDCDEMAKVSTERDTESYTIQHTLSNISIACTLSLTTEILYHMACKSKTNSGNRGIRPANTSWRVNPPPQFVSLGLRASWIMDQSTISGGLVGMEYGGIKSTPVVLLDSLGLDL